MALPLIGLNVVGHFDGLIDILDLVQRHSDGQLLAGEGVIGPGTGFRNDQELLALGQVDARLAGDIDGGLGHNIGIEMPIVPEHPLQLVLVLALNDVTALVFELFQKRVIDGFEHQHGIVR